MRRGVKARAAGDRLHDGAATGAFGDRAFAGLSRGAGVTLLVIMGAIAVFLIIEAIPALRENTANFFTSREWAPDGDPAEFGIAVLIWGTLVSSLLALAMATPVAVGIALFIAYYAPRRFAGPLGYLVDLLAAVPSVVYGLWGLIVLVPQMEKVARFLNDHLGWFPLFGGERISGQSLFTAGVVLAIMILPIISSITREIFLQVPRANVEAAMALGATRWETIRLSVLPYGRAGIVSASMLGLGRALGETIAVAMVLSTSFTISPHLLEAGGATFAANIANSFAEAGETGRGALIASGLVLFVITLVINVLARTVLSRNAGAKP